MFVACVLLFRRGIVGELAQWYGRRDREGGRLPAHLVSHDGT
jgi:branched-chain amino acid transport system permease protein